MNMRTPCWLIVGQNPLSQGEIVHLLYEWGADHKLIHFTTSAGETVDACIVLDEGSAKAVARVATPRPLVYHQDSNGQLYAVDAYTDETMHLGTFKCTKDADEQETCLCESPYYSSCPQHEPDTGPYFTDPQTGYRYVIPR